MYTLRFAGTLLMMAGAATRRSGGARLESPVTRGMRLQVNADDAEAALALLTEFYSIQFRLLSAARRSSFFKGSAAFRWTF
jgi:hypothetical protein